MKMDDFTEIIQPTHIKKLELEDIISYSKKTNQPLTKKLFLKYGYSYGEINWIIKNKEDVIKMHNEEILLKTNTTIQNLKKENEWLKTELKDYEKIKEELELYKNDNTIGWKSKATLIIKKLSDEEWIVQEHRKTKKSNTINKTTHYIKTSHIKNLYKIICLLTEEENKTNYREIVRTLITLYKLKVDIEAFNGGKYRNMFLFPLYYFPMKILEKKGYVEYGGRGDVKRLKFSDLEI